MSMRIGLPVAEGQKKYAHLFQRFKNQTALPVAETGPLNRALRKLRFFP